MRRTTIALAAVLATVTGIALAAGTAGSLDTSFGTNGLAVYDTQGYYTAIWGVSHQTDGKILAAGVEQTSDGQENYFTVGRFDSDGSPDTSFGTDGFAQPFGASADGITFDVVEDPDGKVLAVGRYTVVTTSTSGKGKSGKTTTTSTSYVALVRLNSDGTLDTSFGSGGKVLTELPGSTTNGEPAGFNVLVDSDGTILVAGSCTVTTTTGGTGHGKKGSTTVTSDAIFLARYDSNGSLDTSFGSNGIMVDDITTDDDRIDTHSLAVTASGEIVVGGTRSQSLTAVSGFIRRYEADGTLDTSFGTDGNVVVADGSLVWGLPLTLDSSGRILVGGEVSVSSTETDGFVARYSADGVLDTSFGDQGVFLTGLSGSEQIRALAATSQGIYAGATVFPAGTSGVADGVVLRLDATGALDTSFGSGGFSDLTTPGDSGTDYIFDMSVDGSGNVVIAGYTVTVDSSSGTSYLDWMMARYLGS